MENYDFMFKVVIVGNKGVGKSTFLNSLAETNDNEEILNQNIDNFDFSQIVRTGSYVGTTGNNNGFLNGHHHNNNSNGLYFGSEDATMGSEVELENHGQNDNQNTQNHNNKNHSSNNPFARLSRHNFFTQSVKNPPRNNNNNNTSNNNNNNNLSELKNGHPHHFHHHNSNGLERTTSDNNGTGLYGHNNNFSPLSGAKRSHLLNGSSNGNSKNNSRIELNHPNGQNFRSTNANQRNTNTNNNNNNNNNNTTSISKKPKKSSSFSEVTVAGIYKQISGQNIFIQLWDTHSSERYMAVNKSYFRTAMGAILMYDISDPEGLNKVSRWLYILKTTAKSRLAIMLLGHKRDLEEQGLRQISVQEGQDFAKVHGLLFCEGYSGQKQSFRKDSNDLSLDLNLDEHAEETPTETDQDNNQDHFYRVCDIDKGILNEFYTRMYLISTHREIDNQLSRHESESIRQLSTNDVDYLKERKKREKRYGCKQQ